MKLKLLLLGLVAALGLGLSACTDDNTDPTVGEPGYLTINLRTISTKLSKASGDNSNDFNKLNDLNVFVFNQDGTLFTSTYNGVAEGGNTASITLNTGAIPEGAYCVVVANYGQDLTATTTNVSNLKDVEIDVIKDYSASGLYLTGKAYIIGSGATYTSNVSVAPVMSKINVGWSLTDLAFDNYEVTGVYLANAIGKIKLPIIGTAADITEKIWGTNVSYFHGGLTLETEKDFNFFSSSVANTYLFDELDGSKITTDGSGIYITSGQTGLVNTNKYYYYIGENYANNTAVEPGKGAMTSLANTLVVLRLTPKSTAMDAIKAQGHKYYTYEFTKNNSEGTSIDSFDGFSVKRRTNYNLTFNISQMGTAKPFEKLSGLTVTVTAAGWEDSSISN